MMTELSAERLRDLLDYDPATGEFSWRIARYGIAAGSKAGSLQQNGYVVISVDGRKYLAHRLAWVHMHGKWPTTKIDHKDTDSTNNRWGNLRLATGTQNQGNRKLNANSTSGFKGVCWDKQFDRWRASIKCAGKTRHLGLFNSAEEAHAAYCSAARELFGEFARAA